ncbi:MAG: hypothetical protein JST75_03900 [Bacteroidetes bacterium]|nr:hypothetical protein [Bacteroidota bacterium]
MKKLACIFIMMVISIFAKSQRIIEKNIRCQDSSINNDIKIIVEKNDSKMDYMIKGHLSTGVFKAILYDPEGKKEEGFQLTADPKMDGPRGAKGQMSGPVKLPLQGIWRLHLETQHATGELSYQIYFNKP